MDQTTAGPISTTQDERVMAALSHASIILPNIGIFIPLIIWLAQRDKSRYVAFQALQALIYHVVLIIGWFATIACFVGSIIAVSFASAGFSSSNSGAGALFAFPFLLFCIIALVSLGFVVYGVIAAVMTLQGQDFHYALIGDWLARSQGRA